MTTEHIDVETLSAFADGDLNAVAAQRVERHVGDCGECRRSLERVRALVAAAGALPREVAPPPEVWAAIKQRVPSSGFRVPSRWWHNGWLAAAAGLVLVAGTATLMVFARPGGAAKGTKSSGAQPSVTPVVLAAVERNYAPTLTELRTAFESQRTRLSPSTVRTLDHSIALIDSAIAEARTALVADPGSADLLSLLSFSYQRKVEFMKRATTLSSSL